MISIIVPTMWKFEPFPRYLAELVKIPVVGEIIIINNDVPATPTHPVLQHPKIKFLNQKENIFVNPAWNLGVNHSSYDLLCFLNDDLIVDTKVFYKVDEWLTDSVGLLGIRPENPYDPKYPFVDGSIDILKYNPDISLYSFGTLFFIHKNNWIDVPNNLRMGFGDNWAFDTQIYINKKENYVITNIFYYHYGALTGKTFPDEFYGPEMAIYLKYLESMRNGATMYSKATTDIFEKEYSEACKQYPSSPTFKGGEFNLASDIYLHLPKLRKLAETVSSITELGVRDGQSTRAFLVTNCKLRSYDLYLDNEVMTLFRLAREQNKDMTYQIGNSLTINLEPTDLLFIDTDHTYEQLSAELKRHHHIVGKYIVMHDTGLPYGYVLMTAIMEFLADNSQWKVSYHTSECAGLTILERIS